MPKSAFITGIGGQDGGYLAEFLCAKGYVVHGLSRRAKENDGGQRQLRPQTEAILHYGDLTDTSNLSRLVREIRPDEIYNLGAQSMVAASFNAPVYTANVDALGTLRLLEAIRHAGLEQTTKFYQASTAELYGAAVEVPQRETTPFYPRSPYAAAKLYAYWITVNYRESYGMYACNGMLFNHDSPRRPKQFVTRKITSAMARIAVGLQPVLQIGNMDAKRDWGHARDYVRMQWLMLQQEKPEDFVIATGEQHSVRDFIAWAAEDAGIILRFEGRELDEIGIVDTVSGPAAGNVRPGDIVVRVDPAYFRPTDVTNLVGDPSRALALLGWAPEISARQMCAEMVAADLESAGHEAGRFAPRGG